MKSRNWLLVLVCFPLSLFAQFIYNPLPLQQSDFVRINQLKYTKCLVYKLNGEEKVLAKEAEYGNMGLIAALYEKGTNDNGDSINTSTTYYKFNGKGKLIGTTEQDMDRGESTAVYFYNAAGRLVKKQVAEIDPPTYTYQYTPKGRLVQVNIVQRFPVLDDDGEWTKKTVDKLTYRSIFKYNAKGQLAEEWVYNVKGNEPGVEYKIIWTYDDKGRVISVKRVNSEGTFMNETTYEYNADGLLAKSIEKDDPLGSGDVYVYEYNRNKQSWMK